MPTIYKITNTVTGEIYVGGTVDYATRKSCHKHHLKRKTHHSSLLQKNWNKYGASAFVFEILEHVETRAQLHAREQFWIDQLHPTLNRCPLSSSPKGIKHTKAARRRMSEAHKGKKLSPESIAKRSAKQRGANHPFYGKPRDAKTRKKISRRIKEWFKTHEHPLEGKPVSDDTRDKVRRTLAHEIDQYSLTGTWLRRWRDAREAEETLGIWRTHIWACTAGKAKTAGGFIWRRATTKEGKR